MVEIDLENKFRNWVKKQGGITYKWTGSREKLDLIVITHTGVVGLLELKHPDGGGRLTPQQKKVLADVSKKFEGVAACFNRFDDCVEWYEKLSKGKFLKLEKPTETIDTIFGGK